VRCLSPKLARYSVESVHLTMNRATKTRTDRRTKPIEVLDPSTVKRDTRQPLLLTPAEKAAQHADSQRQSMAQAAVIDAEIHKLMIQKEKLVAKGHTVAHHLISCQEVQGMNTIATIGDFSSVASKHKGELFDSEDAIQADDAALRHFLKELDGDKEGSVGQRRVTNGTEVPKVTPHIMDNPRKDMDVQDLAESPAVPGTYTSSGSQVRQNVVDMFGIRQAHTFLQQHMKGVQEYINREQEGIDANQERINRLQEHVRSGCEELQRMNALLVEHGV
jgi:hypothetical protein